MSPTYTALLLICWASLAYSLSISPVQPSHTNRFRPKQSLRRKMGMRLGTRLGAYQYKRRPHKWWHPHPHPHPHTSTCPSEKKQFEIVQKNLKSSNARQLPSIKSRAKRSSSKKRGTVAQYDTSKRRFRNRQFIRIGVPVSKTAARRMGRPSREGSICSGGKCYRPKPQQEKCLGVDLTFVMDCSGSINRDEWAQLTKFVKDTASIFDVHPDSTRVAAINFGSSACVQFNLGSHANHKQLYSALDKVPKCGGMTHMAKALNLAVKRIHSSDCHFDREDVLDLCIVFTDGQANGPGNVRTAADSLRDVGCEVYAVGIGDQIDHKQLLDIVGGAKGKVVLAKDFRQLLDNRVFCESFNEVNNI